MHLGYTDLPEKDGSKAGALCRSGENTGSSWGIAREKRDANGRVDRARDRRPQDSSNLGNLRVQKVEVALQQETLTA